MKISVGIADDHPIVTNGIATMLKGHPLIELCSVSKNGAELMKSLSLKQPQVILLDIQLPDTPGDELAPRIMKHYPGIAILVLTNMNQTFYVRSMFSSGVKGYLLKSADKETLIDAIEKVSRGEQYIDASLKEQMAYEMLDLRRVHDKPILTKREQQILELVANEKTTAEIAGELTLSISTVENHRLNLFFKFSVKNAAGLVRKAIQLGFIK